MSRNTTFPGSMIWISHITISCAVAYRFLGVKDPLSLSAIGLGSILPDRIETIKNIRILKHRGVSHALWFWSLLAFVWWVYVQKNPSSVYLSYAKFLLEGAFLHLAEDTLTIVGIPIFPFISKRFALKLFKTGSRTETFFVIGVASLCLFI